MSKTDETIFQKYFVLFFLFRLLLSPKKDKDVLAHESVMMHWKRMHMILTNLKMKRRTKRRKRKKMRICKKRKKN
jgi:hypothetical protein